MRTSARPCWRGTIGLIAAIAGLATGATAAHADAPGAALTEPPAALEGALACRGDLSTGRGPVILVHGTGSSPEDSFSFGYEQALPKLGFPVCTVTLPGFALVDQQRSIQYVVHAIRKVARLSGRKVSLIGHSQGATLATYATYFWPDLPAQVEDVIGLAGPYQGTTTADDSCADGSCPVFAWQFRRASKLNAAFHSAARPPGPSFTTIATRLDELVAPAPEAARLDGAANIVLQDLCPARPIDHYLLTGDAVAFALALDALTHPGAADPRRFDPLTCLQTIIPRADLVDAALTAPAAVARVIARVQTAPIVGAEPPLRCPFDATACPPAQPRLALTRRCASGGRLHVGLAGDVGAVRDVSFKLGRRLLRRDVSAPFTGGVGTRALRRTRRTRLRAIAYLDDPAGARVIVARSLPDCATSRRAP